MMVCGGRREDGGWGGRRRRGRGREAVCIVVVMVAEEVMVERMVKGMEGREAIGEACQRSVEGGRFA